MVWKTNIYDPTITRIIALSDIHGDIHSLLIALRDCANVIRKKNGFNPLELDRETEELLESDLNVNDKYIDDLNYEWCGGNTHVVICGDILDGFRGDIIKRHASLDSRCYNDCLEHEYDQIEIKIYRFINALNISSGNRIHKILGNHELINLIACPDFFNYNNYIPDKTKELDFFYYNTKSRIDYFKWNQEGGQLIFKDGAGIFLKINNNLFTHGSIDHNKTLDQYIEINNLLNTNISDHLLIQILDNYEDTLFGRDYDRINNPKKNIVQHIKCDAIKNNLKNFIIKDEKYDINDFRIIVGHCVQFLYDESNKIKNSTFTMITKDNTREIINGPVYTGIKNSMYDDNRIFGISMECLKPKIINKIDKFNPYGEDVKLIEDTVEDVNDEVSINPNEFKIDDNERFIYKVDIGSSRGFDELINISNIRNKLKEKQYLGPRVPQVLEINNNKIQILRSTIKNTRIHQPRYLYEKHTLKIPELNKDHYFRKYLKYKKKFYMLKLNV